MSACLSETVKRVLRFYKSLALTSIGHSTRSLSSSRPPTMSSGALHWTDQQAPRPQSRSRFQQADYSQQYQSLQQDQHRRAPLPGQRNSGSHLQHLPQYGDTNRSRERPQSEDDPAQYVDPFGLRYHDSSRYSGIGTSSVRTFASSLARIRLTRYYKGYRDSKSTSRCAQVPLIP